MLLEVGGQVAKHSVPACPCPHAWPFPTAGGQVACPQLPGCCIRAYLPFSSPSFPTTGGQLGASPGCVAARKAALEGFFDKWQSEPLVLLKWFTLQVRFDCNVVGILAAWCLWQWLLCYYLRQADACACWVVH